MNINLTPEAATLTCVKFEGAQPQTCTTWLRQRCEATGLDLKPLSSCAGAALCARQGLVPFRSYWELKMTGLLLSWSPVAFYCPSTALQKTDMLCVNRSPCRHAASMLAALHLSHWLRPPAFKSLQGAHPLLNKAAVCKRLWCDRACTSTGRLSLAVRHALPSLVFKLIPAQAEFAGPLPVH